MFNAIKEDVRNILSGFIVAPSDTKELILDELTDRYGAMEFLEPELYEKKQLCALSGMKPTVCCPSKINEYVLLVT